MKLAERRGPEMLNLYHTALSHTEALDRAGIATIFSRIRNVPRDGRKGPSGRRPDQLPVAMPGLGLSYWPHQHWTAHKEVWESRGVATEELETILNTINATLISVGSPTRRLSEAFFATQRINEVLNERGLSINFHTIYKKKLLEADVYFLSITPWDQEPLFPAEVQRSIKVSVGGSSFSWELTNVWPGPTDPGVSMESIASAKRFGKLWRRRASGNSQSPAKTQKARGIPTLLSAIRVVQMATRLQKSSAASAAARQPRPNSRERAEAGLRGPRVVEGGGAVQIRPPEAAAVTELSPPQEEEWDIGEEHNLQETQATSAQDASPVGAQDYLDIVRL